MREFGLIVLTPGGLADPSIAIAASRSGTLGVLNLEFSPDLARGREALAALAQFTDRSIGLRLDTLEPVFSARMLEALPDRSFTTILANSSAEGLELLVPRLRSLGLGWLAEVTNIAQARVAWELGANGVIAKGHEAGGWVGDETAFILLQRLMRETGTPVWLQGGIGLHTAAAAYVGGAAGVVLDWQLGLTREARLPHQVKSALRSMDGSETLCLGNELGMPFRVYSRAGFDEVQRLRATAVGLAGSAGASQQWRRSVAEATGLGNPDATVWPIGQDASFAASLADRYETVGGVVTALRAAVTDHVSVAAELRPLDAHAPLAARQGHTYPIAQGPMTRVSDTAAFALQVAEGGGLPFLALALMRAPEVEALLLETQQLLADRPWGVGILGFVPLELRQEQLAVIQRIRPPYALIAGGRPDQAHQLEASGIATYLHVPSPGLLKLFLQDGARRFVFEGRECGGHVGPRSSFVLWDSMIEVLLTELGGDRLKDCQLLFAGGIHDATSAAMVAAAAAPLAARGAQIGVLMGTAYLVTEEAVSAGAILPGFQIAALECEGTVLLESGTGHETRAVSSPFVQVFNDEKLKLLRQGKDGQEVRLALEELNIGRLRIAAKGITRAAQGSINGTQRYEDVDEARQRRDGLYMIGQVAALRERTTTIAALHEEVAVGSAKLLDELTAIEPAEATPQAKPAQIAIIGMGGLLPAARNLKEFWENVLAGRSAIREVPRDRWDWELYFDADRGAQDKIYSRWGGFIADTPFDPLEFGIPPNSLASIDPVQLLCLLVARDTLADAGYSTRPFDRSRTAVILGGSGGTGDLGARYLLRSGLPLLFGKEGFRAAEESGSSLPAWTEDSFAGLLLNVTAGRVANRLDLSGANFVVDAACASSLAAVHLAVKELQTGDADMVLVGGFDTTNNPFGYLCFSKTQALSPTGEARVFDAAGDGIVIGEGVVMLALKRLADAERDGDRIYAVIQGVGASSDGRALGLTAPRPEGQILAFERAYAQAGINPTTVELFEAHGTGTVVGDRTEATSLSRFLASRGAGQAEHAVGSVKSMIGHTKATAGVAALAKITLALHHKVLPPTHGVTKPNQKSGFGTGPLYVNSEARPWIHSRSTDPRRAAVSAFGFGGTNFHAVVEEYWGDYLAETGGHQATVERWPAELLIWRGTDRESIAGSVDALRLAIEAGPAPELRDIAYSLSLAAKSSSGHARLAIVAESIAELPARLVRAASALRKAAGGELFDPSGIYYRDGASGPTGKIAFLFPGQGSQYVNMGRDLALHFSEVREVLERTDRALAARFDGALSRFVYPPPAFTPEEERAQLEALTRTNVAQPALGGIDSGVLALLGSLGVAADLVGGHSYGEYVALYAAGSIDLETLAFLSEARGRAIVEAARGDLGTMAAVRAGEPAVTVALAGMADVWVANLNAPNQTVISGSKDGIAAAIERLSGAGITARPLPVACAFHSPLMAPAQDRLAGALADARISAPVLPVYSNTSAAPHAPDPDAIRAALAQHLLRPVRFADEIEAMYAAGARVFLEVGPGTVLTGLADQVLGDRPHRAIATDAPKRNGLAQLLHALGQLAVLGVDFRLDRLFLGREAHAVDLAAPARAAGRAANAWLVNGSRARAASAASEPAARPPLEGRLLAAGQTASAPIARTNGAVQPAGQNGQSAPSINGPAVPLAEGEQVMLLFQQTMARFVETQKNVMLAYLQGNARGESQLLPPVATTINAGGPVSAAVIDGSVPQPDASPPHTRTDGQDHGATPAEAFSRERLTQELIRIVGERTGYPAEMLDLDVDIEAQLGIDSIKRVEILGTVQRECLPPNKRLPADAMEQLTHVKTLRGIADWISTAVVASGNGSSKHDEPAVGVASQPSGDAAGSIPRSAPELVSLPALPAGMPSITLGGPYLVTDDGRGVAAAVADRLRAAGAQVVLIGSAASAGVTSEASSPDRIALDLGDAGEVNAALATLKQTYGAVAGVIHLLPLAPLTSGEGGVTDFDAWRVRQAQQVKGLFHLVRAVAADLRGGDDGRRGWVIAASGMGGHFGYGEPVPGLGLTGQGGLLGMIKALALEWPETLCRGVDVDPNLDPSLLADFILREALADGPAEVGITSDGGRVSVAPALAPLDRADRSLQITGDWVILVTGGARGITAEAATYLARRYGPTLILAGSAPPPPEQESTLTVGQSGARALKVALIDELKREGAEVSLTEVERRYSSLLKEREIRANIAAMRSAGARVTYFQADLRDEDAVRGLLEGVYSGWGRLDAWIHGAGVIEDKLAQEKSPESFARVYDTKADSAYLISKHVRSESLKVAAFFSSASGFFGNRGQADYAAANEVLNKLALHLDANWPGRVVSMNWGPWLKTGMVSDELQRDFVRRGIRLIPLDVGCALLDDEIAFGRKGQAVVVLAGGSWGAGRQASEGEALAANTGAEPSTSDAPLQPPVSVGGPLLAGRASTNPIAGGVEVGFTLNSEDDRYLEDHVIDGSRVFPFAMALELAAEVAQIGWPDLHVTAYRDFGVLKGLVLPDGPMALRAVARAHPEAPTERVGIDVLVEIFDVADSSRPHYRGTLELSDRPLASVAAPHSTGNGAGLTPLLKSTEEIYSDWMFHGPMFRGIAEFAGISPDRLVATLTPSDPAALVRGAAGAGWLLDPVVFDSALQMIIVWVRLNADATPLPARFKRYTRYGTLSEGPVTARLKPSAGGAVTDAVDIDFVGSDGALLGRLEAMETAFSKALNRLGGANMLRGDIAIIGMAGLFPGAPNVDRFWQNIVSKVDAVTDPPPESWDAGVFYDPDSAENDRVYCKKGGFISPLAFFDPADNGVMPRSVEGGEPDQWLALQVARAALADAGLAGDFPERHRTAVVIGKGTYLNRGNLTAAQHGIVTDQTLDILKSLHPEFTESDLGALRQELKRRLPPFNSDTASGLIPNIIAGRIANRLDLMGPSYTVDAACASSLIALDVAMRDLLTGKVDLALVGGSHVVTPVPVLMLFCQLGALSRRERIRPFDQDADGTILGEGIGMVVVKRLEDAERDGNRIYAVVKGIGTASDGRGLSVMAPRLEGEVEAMRRAYEMAGISPATVGLVEAHGTATTVGDATEVRALTQVWGDRPGELPKTALGSVKSMISHLMPAAGIAALIKTALALHHKVLPPTINIENPNPELGLENSPFYLNTETRPWIHGGSEPRRAAVSSFGFGGINAHVALEEYSAPAGVSFRSKHLEWDSEAFVFSGADRPSLIADVAAVRAYLGANPAANLKDLAYTLNTWTLEGEHRLAVVATSQSDLVEKLDRAAARLSDPSLKRIKEVQGIYYFSPDARPAGKTAFLFPGEGSQYVNMLGDLCVHFPEVRAHFDRIDRVFEQRGRGYLPSDAIFPRPSFTDEGRRAAESSIWQMEGAVESVLTANSALLLLLGKLGIQPDAVLGHSTGEYSAMLAAGMIDLDSDEAVAAFSSELNAHYHEAKAKGEIASAALVAVGGSVEAIAGTLATISSGLHIAMDNCPHQAVIAGPPAEMTRAIEALTAQGLICERLPFDRPNHTPLFAAYAQRLRPFLARWISDVPHLPVYSCTTQAPFPDDLAACREIASEHWARPVAFRGTVERMAADGFGTFIEAGTSGNLVAFVDDILRGKPHLSVPANLKSRSGTLQLNHLVAMVAATGAPVALEYLYAARAPKLLDISDLAPAKARPLMKLATGWPPMTLSDDVATQFRTRSTHAIAQAQATVPAPMTPAPPVLPVAAGTAVASGQNRRKADAALPAGPAAAAVGATPQVGGTTPPASGATPPAGGALAAYFATMDQFLAAQQEVMQAFLTGRASSAPLGVAGVGQELLGAKQGPAGVPGVEPGGAIIEPVVEAFDAAPGAGEPLTRDEIGAMLLQLVSDRTGYPQEMLDQDLDLEASLGIDSIKRVEILGTLQRQTQILRAQDMEALSTRKTLRGIIDYLLEAASRPSDAEAQAGRDSGVGSGIAIESTDTHMPLLRELTAYVPGESVTARTEISLETMPFLADHTLGRELSESDSSLNGLPIVPFTVSMELLAEAAALLMPGLQLAGMRDVRAYRWITLDVPRVMVEVTAQRTGATGEAYVNLRELAPGGAESAPILEAIVRFAPSLAPAPVAEPMNLTDERSSRWTSEALYREGMFHGPAFRGVKSIDRIGSDGAVASLVVGERSDLIQGRGSLVTDPVLLDLPGQVVGFWTAETLNEAYVVFPYYLGELEFFDAPLPAMGEAQCRARVELVGERQVRSDLEIVGSDNRVAVRFKAWEDRRFDLPPAFHRLLMGRDIGGLVSEWLPPQGSQPGLIGAMASLDTFPHGFLIAHGAIWQKVLACNILGANERELWHNLNIPETRRLEWLLGRLAAKAALLRLLGREGKAPRPAEVEIVPDEFGRPVVRGAWFSRGPEPLAVSISHSSGVAIALAGSVEGLGVDLEHAANMTPDVLAAAFVAEELALMSGQAEEGWPLRFWCAKEAAIKALGLGNAGSPFSVRVRSFSPGSGDVEVVRRNGEAGDTEPEEAILVTTVQQGDYVMAVAVLNVDGFRVKDRV